MLTREEAAGVFKVFRRPQQVTRAGAAIRHEDASGLVVLTVCDRGRIPAERNEAQGLFALGPHVESPDAIERVELRVQRIATILGCEQLMLVRKGEVVERVVVMIAEEEERDPAIMVSMAIIVA